MYFSKRWGELMKDIQINSLLVKLTSVSKDNYLKTFSKIRDFLLRAFEVYFSI